MASVFTVYVMAVTTCASRFTWEHIVDNTRCVSQGMLVRKVSNSKRDLQDHSRSPVVVPLDRPHMISY